MITINNAKRYLQLSADKEVSLVGNGTIATATQPDHGYKTGDQVEITNTSNFNGVYSIVRLNANQYTFNNAYNGSETGLISKFDFVLGLLIDGVKAFINDYTGYEWVDNANNLEELVDIPNDGVIFIETKPVKTIVSIKVSSSRNWTDPTKFNTLTSEFLFYPKDSRVELLPNLQCLFGTRQTCKIVYNTGTIPNAVTMASYELLSYHFRNWNDKNQNVINRTNEGEQLTFQKEIPESIKQMLDPFKRVTLGDGVRSKTEYF